MKRTYLALAAAAAAAAAMTDLAAPPRGASAAPSRAPLAQQQDRQQQRRWTQPSLDSAAPAKQEALTALPPGAPPPLPETITAPVRESQSPRIVALQVIPFSP